MELEEGMRPTGRQPPPSVAGPAVWTGAGGYARRTADGSSDVLQKVARTTGWTLIATGVLILLYVVYLLFFTGLTTSQAQQDLLEQWQLDHGPIEATALPAEPRGDDRADVSAVDSADPGDAYAVLWFERPGSDERPVYEEPLFVVEGVALDDLRRGPGHYPESAAPGQPGNFAVAGHRTTYGQPFYDLDALEPGDEVHVVDREGREYVYDVVEQRVVAPGDVWVVGDDPLGTGRPMLTLTTCHPRFSAAQRLIIFAQLRDADGTRS